MLRPAPEIVDKLVRRGRRILRPGQEAPAVVLYERLQGYTMTPPDWFAENVRLVAGAADAAGDLVECGTWKGGMSAAMASTIPGRRSVLFDSFEGLPPVTEDDGDAAAAYMEDPDAAFDHCTATERDARDAMALSGSEDVEIIRGWFEDTVPPWAAQGRPIAVLRIDADWYEPTLLCLRHLYPLVWPGGIVILDDYLTWEGSSRAVHDYLSETKSPARLRETPVGVVYLHKP